MRLLREGAYGPLRVRPGSVQEAALILEDMRERERGLLRDYLRMADQLSKPAEVLERLTELTVGHVNRGVTDADRIDYIRGLRGVRWGDYLRVDPDADEVADDRLLKEQDPIMQHYL